MPGFKKWNKKQFKTIGKVLVCPAADIKTSFRLEVQNSEPVVWSWWLCFTQSLHCPDCDHYLWLLTEGLGSFETADKKATGINSLLPH